MPTQAENDLWAGSYLVAVNACLFCGSGEASPATEGVGDWFFGCVPGTFAFACCDHCGSLYQSARLADSHLPHAYSSYYTHENKPLAAQPSGLRQWLRSAYVDWRFKGLRNPVSLLGAGISRLSGRNMDELDASYRFAPPGPVEVLDYGCGNGAFLRVMEELGNTAIGVDFDPAAIAAVRAAGGAAFTPEEAETQDWNGRFDFISLAHVIEHVTDPVDLLGRLAGWLKPGGRLFIEAPNADAAGLDIFERYWRGLEVPRHLAIPSRAGIDAAASKAGLTVRAQLVRRSVREWLWAESLEVVTEDLRKQSRDALQDAPTETLANAEFLTLLLENRPSQ